MKKVFSFLLICISDLVLFIGCKSDNTTSPETTQRWSTFGNNMNCSVNLYTVYNSELIGGILDTTLGNYIKEYPVRWKDTSWLPFGLPGLGTSHMFDPPYVRSLTVYNGELIVGGYFISAGWESASNIAKWNGYSWSALGNGFNERVDALTVYNGELIAGGWFKYSGGDSVNYIARWNGSIWLPLGSGMSGCSSYNQPWVSTLINYNGVLIAGGNFKIAGGVSANYIAQWNGNFWAPLSSGMSGGNPDGPWVSSLSIYNGALIASGNFTTAGGVSANYIAQWNGNSWSSLSSGIGSEYPYVYELIVYNGELIVGGDFKIAGGMSANSISRWNGSSWMPLGSGLGNGGYRSQVWALIVYNNDLIVGGNFTTAGGISSDCIAKWH